MYQQHKTRTLQLFSNASAIAKTEHYDEVAAQLNEAAARLEAERLFVVVCGEYKQGKSSLINAMLDTADLLPVDVDITTSLVSTITYGEREQITVVTDQTTHEISRAEVADYASEQRNPGNVRGVRMLVISLPHPLLRNGLVLVDTPGVGGLNQRHSDIASAFLPNADAILFVSDALEPLSLPEVKFVERVGRSTKDIVLVVTKIDVSEQASAVVKASRDRIAEALGVPQTAVRVVSVSSSLRQSYQRSGDPADLEDSNFANLEHEIWRLAHERRGALLLARALSSLAQLVRAVERPLSVELETLQQQNRQAREERERQLREAQTRLQMLLEQNVEWRTQLSDQLVDARETVLDLFRQRFTAIERGLEQQLANVHQLSQLDDLAQELDLDIGQLIAALREDLIRQATEVELRMETLTGLSFASFQRHDLLTERPCAELGRSSNPELDGIWSKTLMVVRRAMFDSGAGGVTIGLVGAATGGVIGALFGGVGALPGMAIGQAIGGLIGGLSGGITGLRQGLRQVREQDHTLQRREVGRVLAHYLEDSRRLCQQMVYEAVRDLERSMRDELTRQLRAEKQTVEGMIETLRQASATPQHQIPARVAEIKRSLEPLQRIQQEASTLLKQSVEQHETARSQQAPLPPAGRVEQGVSDPGAWADA